VQSSRRLERECQRNIELVWLTGRLMPDFKTIADFRKDNGEAIVLAKRLNKGRQLPAEVVEGRASPKGNSR
jgi:hypothetical protein